MVLKKEYLNKILVGLYLFALACLYSVEHINAYYIITVGEFVIAFVSAFLHRRFKRILSNGYFLWLIMVFMVYFLTPIFNSSYSDFPYAYFALHFMNTMTIVLLFFDKSIDRIVDVLCDGSVLATLLTVIFIIINEADIIRAGALRIGGSASGNVDVLGMYLGLMSIFVLYKVIINKQGKYIAIYALQVIFMLLTGSKQALIYIAVSYLVFIKYSYKKNIAKYVVPFIIFAGFIIAIFEVPALYDLIGYRIQIMLVSFGFRIGDLSSSYSTDRRMQMIQKALELFSQKPIFGGGWGYFTAKSGFNVYSHTTYTEILATYGLFGFIVYYSLYYKTLIKYLTVKKNNIGILFCVILVAILISDIARITFSQTSINYVMLFLAWKAVKYHRNSVFLIGNV